MIIEYVLLVAVYFYNLILPSKVSITLYIRGSQLELIYKVNIRMSHIILIDDFDFHDFEANPSVTFIK